MSVTEDASTPAVATTAGGSALTSLTSASFSPPAGSVLVAECVINYATNPATFPAITVSDSASGTWVAGPVVSSTTAFGKTQIFTRVVTTAPGSITVTMSRGADTSAAMLMLAVRVCNGAKVSNPIGASNTVAGTGIGAGTQYGLPITPQAIGSLIYVCGQYAANTSPSALASTTSIQATNDSTDGGELTVGKSSSVTSALTTQTLGWTTNLTSGLGFTAAALEIVPTSFGASSPTVLPGNILTTADSDFESGTSTWAAFSGANAPVTTSSYSFVGSKSLTWTANSTSDSFIATGFYKCTPNNGYAVSGYVITPNANHDTYIGINWYTSGHSFISTTWGNDNPSTAGEWQPVVAALTSPSNAAFMQVTVWVGTLVTNNEPFAIDLAFVSDVPSQILIDWTNPVFSANSAAGTDFSDATPWVRFDQGITTTRGRQDAVSEIQSGQASFSLQNDSGWFTPQRSTSPYYPNVSLGARVQINEPDSTGVWHTRFDGAVSLITYAVDTTGNTNLATISASDVLAFMNRQNPMSSWTQETVMANQPFYHWTLNDSGNDNTALESSGNNGPVLRMLDNASGAQAPTVSWQNSNGGVETLADAVGPATADGSEYWTNGYDYPLSFTRGLDSGLVGPYSTPLPSVYFKPALTAQTAENLFVGTDGYQLDGQLYQGSVPTPIVTSSASNTWSFEIWFMQDPGIKTNVGHDYGPFTIFSLGSGRRSACFVAGLYYSGGSNLNMEIATYAEPPSFPMNAFGVTPTVVLSTTTPMTLDAVPLPHHLVVTVQGASTGATATMWLDGVSSGSITLPAGQIFDTVSVGGAYGGHGNFYGNLSCFSIYNYILTPNQIINDCMVGQYGYWEQTTDNAIAAIGDLASLPPFWTNLSGQTNGLSMTDYQTIAGSTALANMQVYEQAEHGLLFVNAMGQLSFDTRDWRMGYGAPDLALPADSYHADLGYELIDTYLLNEAAVGTTVFTSGIASISQASANSYGTYANGTQNSPIQLPLVAWNRSYDQLGIANYGYWQDPNLTDNASWQTNTRNSPRLTCGSLTIDLLTLDPSWGITQAQLLALDIDNMITLTSGSTIASFPDQTGAFDFFIEGINETTGTDVWTRTFYTSPASVQRAWKPGDATYGQLGTTSRIGISQPDTNIVPSLGKTVSHDGGPPYWPPQFQTVPGGTQIGFANGSTLSPAISVTNPSFQGECILVQVLAAASATITVADSVNTGNYTLVGSVTLSTNQVQYLYAFFNSLPLPIGATVTVTTGTTQQYTTSAYRIYGISAVDIAAVTATGTSVTPAVTGGTMSASNDFELVIVANNSTQQTKIPSGWTQLWWNYNSTYQNQLFWRQATTSSPDAFSGTFGSSIAWGAIALSFTVNPYFMNNPSGNGHNFIGALDIRGIRDTLATALNPPLCVVGAVNDNQTYTTGNNQIQGRIVWDTVYVDTVGGMGIVPGWPNWYCVLVPGFYEIDTTLTWQIQSSGATGVRTGWIIVAQKAAQAVATGNGGPYTTTYVCPIGEQLPPNNNSINPVNVASTRVYLGVGDMIGLGGMQTQGSSIATGVALGGATMSIRWLGYNTSNDQSPTAGLPGGSSIVTPPVTKSTYVKTYAATGTYAYNGSGSSWTQPKDTNGLMYQGEYSGGQAEGSCVSYALFNHTQIAADTSGATITKVQLRMQNQHCWYFSGGSLIVGWTTNSTFGSSAPTSGMHYDIYEIFFEYGQTLTTNIPISIGKAFQSGGATALAFGNNQTTNLKYYGFWTGNTYPELIITYVK